MGIISPGKEVILEGVMKSYSTVSVSSTGSDIRHRLQETLQVEDAPPAPAVSSSAPLTTQSQTAPRKPSSATSVATPIGYASLPVWPYAAPVAPRYVTPPPRPVK